MNRRLKLLLPGLMALIMAGPAAADYLITTPESLLLNSADYLVRLEDGLSGSMRKVVVMR